MGAKFISFVVFSGGSTSCLLLVGSIVALDGAERSNGKERTSGFSGILTNPWWATDGRMRYSQSFWF